MSVMSFDISATSTGVCLPDGSCDTLEPPAGIDEATRCAWWEDTFRILLTDHQPTTVVIEGAFSHGLHPGTNNALLKVHGVFLAQFARTAAVLVVVPPLTLKKQATGSGKATKDDMVARAIELGGDVANNDEADAWLMWRGVAEGWWA